MPYDAYTAELSEESKGEAENWIIIGEISKAYPMFHVKKWDDIFTDINCAYPQFFNIRKTEEGV
jgi:hypothetical protein